MPLKPGKSNAVVSENIRELHSGKTHANTERKFGKKKADRQSVAIAMKKAGRGRSQKRSSQKTRAQFWS